MCPSDGFGQVVCHMEALLQWTYMYTLLQWSWEFDSAENAMKSPSPAVNAISNA